jgi:hypothetical protein
MTDDEIETALTEVSGIGLWTAHGFLIFKAANTLRAEALESDPTRPAAGALSSSPATTATRKRKSSRCSRTRASPRSTSSTSQQAARCNRSTIRSPASTSSDSEEHHRWLCTPN